MLWIAVVVGTVTAVVSLVLIAYGPRLGYTLREPTDDEAKRLGQLRNAAGGPDVAIRITTGEGSVKFDLVGLPGRRRIVVTDVALETLGDDSLRPLLAVEDERARTGIEVTQAIVTGIAIGLFSTSYVADVGTLPAMIGAWAVVFAGIGLARRRHYGADETVAEKHGRETLRGALERAAEHRGDSLEPGRRWRAAFEVEPSVGARLERLGK